MTNFLLVYGFRKMFFIGQILKRVYVKLSFDQLLILFCLQIFFVWSLISHSIKEINKIHYNTYIDVDESICFWYRVRHFPLVFLRFMNTFSLLLIPWSYHIIVCIIIWCESFTLIIHTLRFFFAKVWTLIDL